MLVEALAIGGLGVFAALGLGVAARVFKVEVDPLVEAVEEALPGANCGGCGYAGCSAAAEAMAKGIVPPSVCVGGGPEVQADVAAILGMEITATEPRMAQVGCRYPVERSDLKYNYHGFESCRAAVRMYGGPKKCPVGCIGLGSCAEACPFDALSIGPDGLPVVDEYKCTGCGTCVRTCPVSIMQLTSVTDRILGEYTTDECTAPCQRTCPAGIDIPAQIKATALGDYEGALLVIKERNPLPLICGRICPHPCEVACRRNLADEPVAINPLKRFVSDYERNSGKRLNPYRAPSTGRKAAVIGGGAEGLSAAWFLARLGHDPEIYEAQEKLGGLLRTVIPASRLPREVLDWEIEGILEMGVDAHTGKALGDDYSIGGLLAKGHEAVLLATGGWDSMLTRGAKPDPAPGLPGLYLLLPLTLNLAMGGEVEAGKKVVLIGGGADAVTMAARLLDMGAEDATAIFRQDKEKTGLSEETLTMAEEKGISLWFEAKVTGLRGRGDNLSSLSLLQAGTLKEDLAVDTLVAAGGRMPELVFYPDPDEEPAEGAEIAWVTGTVYRGPGEDAPGIFQDVEPVSDYAATVEAIAGGRRAAAVMHGIMTGDPVKAPVNMITDGVPVLDVDRLDNLILVSPRQKMPQATKEQRLDPDFEVELGLEDDQVRKEAQRCLNCGLLCYYRSKYN